jgi:hypothetical protein
MYYQLIRSGDNATFWNKICEIGMHIKQELQW